MAMDGRGPRARAPAVAQTPAARGPRHIRARAPGHRLDLFGPSDYCILVQDFSCRIRPVAEPEPMEAPNLWVNGLPPPGLNML